MSVSFEALKIFMQNSFVLFSYQKVNGEMRLAVGTTSHDLISQILGDDNEHANKERKTNSAYCHYFDLSRMGFRQFRKECALEVYRMLNFDEALAFATMISFKSAEFSCDDFHNLIKKLYGIDVSNTADCHEVYLAFEGVDCAENEDSVISPEEVIRDTEKFCKHIDNDASWCYQHNGGRGLNGVMLSAAGNGGSSTMGWPGAGSSFTTHAKDTNADGIEGTPMVEVKNLPSSKSSSKQNVVAPAPSVKKEREIVVAPATQRPLDANWDERRFELIKTLLMGKADYDERLTPSDERVVRKAIAMADYTIDLLKK